MHLKATLLKWLRLFGGDTRRSIIGYIVLSLIAASGGIYLLTKTAITWVFQKANIPAPLWVTILLILCCLYTYVKVVKNSPKLNQPDQTSKVPPRKTMSFTIEDLKWNTKIYDDGHFEVDKISICLEHDLTLIRANVDYYCPEYIKKNCKIMIDHIEYDLLYATAKSYIDKEIRNKKCQPVTPPDRPKAGGR